MSASEAKRIFEEIAKDNSICSALQEHIDDNTEFIADLGFDSLSIIRLISDIESKFEIEFDIEDLLSENITTYGVLLKCVLNKLKEKGILSNE
jgi:phosphopantetheine attachment domain protein